MRKHLVALVLVLSLLSPVFGGTAAWADAIDIYWTKHGTDTDLDGAAWYECELRVNISPVPNWKLVDTCPEIARWSMGMTYDSDRQVIVMFGGRDGFAPLADTWEYDGNSWYSVTTSNAPVPRIWHAMAYDSARHRTVLFGGLAYGTSFGDTWEYDGDDWQQITTSHSPPAMSQMSMVYDSWRNKIVLFGGQDYTGDLADTWEYDGTDWTKVDTPVSPPRGTLAAMAFDSARGKVVLFGSGVVSDPGPSDCATWEYDGITWTGVHTATSPPGRWAHAMAYDPARQRIVLFGGYGTTYPSGSEFDDTWEYDGTNWAPISVPTSPAARQQHGMTYDLARGCVVMFGGIGPGGVSGETWEYRGVKPAIEATVDFDPDTLNLKSKGRFVTAYIELPEGYTANDIDVSTVLLDDEIQAEPKPIGIGDYNGNGIDDVMVKFNRFDVQSIAEPGNEVELKLSGQLVNGTAFEGTDTIRVISQGK
jgi:hypothetical protein